MRVLACSDIHGNVEAVERLRAREANDFDAVVIAGDIGKPFREIVEVFETFACPVMYVLGNHDHDVPYDLASSLLTTHHLDDGPVRVGPCLFAGFSGCPTNWGLNPIAQELRSDFAAKHATMIQREAEVGSRTDWERLARTKDHKLFSKAQQALRNDILRESRNKVAIDFGMNSRDDLICVAITHEYLTNSHRAFEGVNFFLHGHNHRFHDRLVRGKRHINVAALDQCFTVGSKSTPIDQHLGFRRINAGCYVTFNVVDRQVERVQAHRFGYDDTGYVREPHMHFGGAPIVGADPDRDSIEAGLT